MSDSDTDHILHELHKPLFEHQDGIFQLGLVLNGTVSSGAWTAGAIDALFETLDAWEEAKRQSPDSVPMHGVRVEIAGGTSGGAVCAALMARVAEYRFPHVADAGEPASSKHGTSNPFWDVWVEHLDIANMLHFDRLTDPGVPPESVLSGLAITKAVDAICDWKGEPLDAWRGWLADPFRVLMTQTNLRGVPYTLKLAPQSNGGPRATQFVSHADHIAFVIGSGHPRGDEVQIQTRNALHLHTLAEHARASAAFPVGFPAVRLARDRAHYEWRGLMLPGEKGMPPTPKRLIPRWPSDEKIYEYDAVDGGALNNSPFRLVHTRMAGLGKSFPRHQNRANAAIIIMDPFVAQNPISRPGDKPSLPSVLGQLANALVAHGRYTTAEILLASEDGVESRHLFTAGRKRKTDQVWGAEALATSGLGAFLGFLDRGLRVHDFLLGRQNMIAWLRRHFVLPHNHQLFRHGRLSKTALNNFAVNNDVPIIPVVNTVTIPTQPIWPTPQPWWPKLEQAGQSRLTAVGKRLLEGKAPVPGLIAGRISRAGWSEADRLMRAAIKDVSSRR